MPVEFLSIKQNHIGNCLLSKTEEVKNGHNSTLSNFYHSSSNYLSLLINTVIANKEHLTFTSKFLCYYK